MFSYRSLLKQAWTISWCHKYLWLFGLFASLTAVGGSVEYQIITQNFNQNLVDGSFYYLSGLLASWELLRSLWIGLGQVCLSGPVAILNALSVLLIGLTLLVFFIWLAISSQAALVDSVKKILSAKKKESELSPRNGLTAGNKHFWPVLGLNILIKILINVAFFIISLPLLFMVMKETTALLTFYTILFVIFLPIAVSLSLIVKYAIAYQVLENRSFVASLEKGWGLFWKNWLVNLEMAIILFIINFFVGLAAIIVMSLFLLPLLLLGLMAKAVWLVSLMLIIGLVIVIFVGSFLTTFQISSWTTLFLRLKEKGGTAKLERVFRKTK